MSTLTNQIDQLGKKINALNKKRTEYAEYRVNMAKIDPCQKNTYIIVFYDYINDPIILEETLSYNKAQKLLEEYTEMYSILDEESDIIDYDIYIDVKGDDPIQRLSNYFKQIVAKANLIDDSAPSLNENQDDDSVCGAINSLLVGDIDPITNTISNKINENKNDIIAKLNEITIDLLISKSKEIAKTYGSEYINKAQLVLNALDDIPDTCKNIFCSVKYDINQSSISNIKDQIKKEYSNTKKTLNSIKEETTTNITSALSDISDSIPSWSEIENLSDSFNSMDTCRMQEELNKLENPFKNKFKNLTYSKLSDCFIKSSINLAMEQYKVPTNIQNEISEYINDNEMYKAAILLNDYNIDVLDINGYPDFSKLENFISLSRASQITKSLENLLPNDSDILNNDIFKYQNTINTITSEITDVNNIINQI